jgi:hypothetical protein
MYLPPFKDCTMDFLKGVINGSKKVGLDELIL